MGTCLLTSRQSRERGLWRCRSSYRFLLRHTYQRAQLAGKRPDRGLAQYAAHLDVRPRPDLEGILRDQLSDEVVFHVAPNAIDDRDDGDEEHDADGDADEGEEALELLHPDLRQREPDGFEERHGRMLGARDPEG